MPIDLEDITKTYGPGAPVLENLSLSIGDGEFMAIVGPSGCGKTTLLNLIGGLDRSESGTVRVAGQVLNALTDRQLSQFRNQTVGFIFQMNWLHPRLTALENVMLPALVAGQATRQAQSAARAQLELVALEPYAQRFPGELSGGQVQRVAIARALVMSPAILLADEPTGNLDTKTGGDILGLITRLNRDRQLTVVLVTHEPAIRQYARATLHMHEGRLSQAPEEEA